MSHRPTVFVVPRLTDDELAIDDARETNDRAVQVLGNKALKAIRMALEQKVLAVA